jgi:hypothetical protein
MFQKRNKPARLSDDTAAANQNKALGAAAAVNEVDPAGLHGRHEKEDLIERFKSKQNQTTPSNRMGGLCEPRVANARR